MKKLKLTLFRLGALNALLVAIYHFYLPYHFSWQEKTSGSHEIFTWSLMVINFDWSMLAALFAVVLLYFSAKPDQDTGAKRVTCLAYIAAWAVHTLYLAIDPAPLPEKFSWLGMLFVGFAALTTVMLLAGLSVFPKQKQKS